MDIWAMMKAVAYLTSKHVAAQINDAKTPAQVNEIFNAVWRTPGAWHRNQGPNQKATIDESAWEYLARLAKAKCETLGGQFVDPR